MFDLKFIPFALALYNKESNGKQLLFSRCTSVNIGRWAFINVVIVPFLFYKGKYFIQESRRQRALKKYDEKQMDRFQKDLNDWKANGKEIPYEY